MDVMSPYNPCIGCDYYNKSSQYEYQCDQCGHVEYQFM